MTRGSLAIVVLVTACGGKVEPEAVTHAHTPGGGSKIDSSGGTTGQVVSALCKNDTSIPPNHLECTGLYSDFKKKTVADDAHEYEPGVPLWSDNAKKKRWIYIPKGQKIDASNPNQWHFPIGTKVWKEFKMGEKRMETRLWMKKAENLWAPATYAWNDAETAADISVGGDVPSPDGGVYHIPPHGECEQCHRGRHDRVLGFEQVSLGLELEGATGWRLADLVKNDLIDPPPEQTSLTIGDDGTGKAAPALGWLHTNCGVSCHNDYTEATAYSAGMLLRLDPTQLDGRAVNDFDAVKTTLGIVVHTPNWPNATRIVPGDKGDSLLYHLITTRASSGDPNASQMPPIATRLVDWDHTKDVGAWIDALQKSNAADGGGGG